MCRRSRTYIPRSGYSKCLGCGQLLPIKAPRFRSPCDWRLLRLPCVNRRSYLCPKRMVVATPCPGLWELADAFQFLRLSDRCIYSWNAVYAQELREPLPVSFLAISNGVNSERALALA